MHGIDHPRHGQIGVRIGCLRRREVGVQSRPEGAHVALIASPAAAIHPMVANMKALPRCQADATVDNGAVAKGVEAPPIRAAS